jgi:hypothetical protein
MPLPKTNLSHHVGDDGGGHHHGFNGLRSQRLSYSVGGGGPTRRRATIKGAWFTRVRPRNFRDQHCGRLACAPEIPISAARHTI